MPSFVLILDEFVKVDQVDYIVKRGNFFLLNLFLMNFSCFKSILGKLWEKLIQTLILNDLCLVIVMREDVEQCSVEVESIRLRVFVQLILDGDFSRLL